MGYFDCLLAALKKWRDLSNELHETTVTFKNECQETSLVAATINLVGSNLSEDKSSVTSKAEMHASEELEQRDDKSDTEYFVTVDHPTEAY